METGSIEGVARRPVDQRETARANRMWWDAAASGYQREHGAFLGSSRFVWGPEGLDEADARLLGPASSLIGRTLLEIGCGAAQCARWLRGQGARAVGVDLSEAQLRESSSIDHRMGTRRTPVAAADACALPFVAESFDIVCSAYGAVPFVADSALLMREVARVLRPGGRWVFSTTHPVRWVFPDDPGRDGLIVRQSYFDRRPYVEVADDGSATYVEHHRTLGDRVRELTSAGLRLIDLVEPEWPDGHDQSWGAWSPLRGRLLPGTAVFVCVRD